VTGSPPVAACLRVLAPALWPRPATVHIGPRCGATGGPSYVVVPSVARPRLLVPAGSRRAGCAAVRYATAHPRHRTRTAAVAWLFRSGLGPHVFGDRVVVAGSGTIEAHLAAVLGREVLLSVYIGPSRANRKPVLQLLDPDGAPLAFAKLGVDPLTRRLVAGEARALRLLAQRPLRGVQPPAVLHQGQWNGLEVLLLSALPVWAADRPDDALRIAAMRAVAAVDGLRDEPVDGGYGTGLATRVAALADRSGVAALRAVVGRAVASGVRLRTGCWHGDWIPGNQAVLTDRVLLWDWERFGAGVPVGYDALHHDLHAAITVRRVAPAAAVRSTAARAAALLAPFGVSAPAAPVVAALYLAELGARYLGDGQAEAGARLGRLDEWLTPVLGGLPDRFGAG
jgi:hypothetical protein